MRKYSWNIPKYIFFFLENFPGTRKRLLISHGRSHPLRKQAYPNILKILPPKMENFQLKNSDIFIFLLKTYIGEAVLTSTHNLCFSKIMYTPVTPSFTLKKWGLRESKLYKGVFVMGAGVTDVLLYMKKHVQIRRMVPNNISCICLLTNLGSRTVFGKVLVLVQMYFYFLLDH